MAVRLATCPAWVLFSTADHGFVISERVPSERDARGKVLLICGQGKELGVKFVAQTVAQIESGGNRPGVLSVERGQWAGIVGVGGIPEALLVNLRQSERCRL